MDEVRIPLAALKGRGSATRLAHRFARDSRQAFDDGWATLEEGLAQPGEQLPTEVIWEEARSIISSNESPDVYFDRSINPYRGCEHGCIYCLDGETKILMADGSTKALGDLRVGDEIIGTRREGHYRRYVRTAVLAHWETRKPAYRVGLADGTSLEASGDHRFLTERGWKSVARAERGAQRPYLTLGNSLMGFGAIAPISDFKNQADYRRGYLCGVIRGDGHLRSYHYERAGGSNGDQHRFRLAMTDAAALDRTALFLADFGIRTDRFLFQEQTATRKYAEAIRTSARDAIAYIQQLIHWPDRYEGDWARGFLAGIFDAEGCYQGGTMRIANTDEKIIGVTRSILGSIGFDSVLEVQAEGRSKPLQYLRIRGGLREHLRFFRACDPAIARKRDIAGQAVKSGADLGVAEIEPLDGERELFDITTGTGDFVANGVISHNCYARPNHSYINLSPGLDFETKIVAKRNIAEVLRREMARRGYEPRLIAIGTATDCYQPLERELRLTRSVIELMHETRHAFSLVTKSSGVERDLDLIAPMAAQGLVAVNVTITTLDAELTRKLEPRAAAPHRRLRILRTLAEHGVPCGVSLAPQIPFLNEDMEQVMEAAWDAGARSAFYHVIRLPWEVSPLFQQWLEVHYPQRAARVMARIHDMRGGKDYDSDFATRMKGSGPWAQLIEQRFRKAVNRIGFNQARVRLDTTQFRPPSLNGQGDLF
jgi:DNA repair photolyase